MRSQAILMSTYKIPFSTLRKKITLNYPKSATMGCFPKRMQKQVRNSRGKRAIRVRAIEVLLYNEEEKEEAGEKE